MKRKLGAKTFIALLAAIYFLAWANLEFNTSIATLVGITILSSGLTVLAYAIASVLGWSEPMLEMLKKLF